MQKVLVCAFCVCEDSSRETGWPLQVDCKKVEGKPGGYEGGLVLQYTLGLGFCAEQQQHSRLMAHTGV